MSLGHYGRGLLITAALLLVVVVMVQACTGLPASVNVTSSVSSGEYPTRENPLILVQANWIPEYAPPPMDVDPFHWITETWMDTIEEETAGRVKFERYPNSTLVDGYNMYKAVLTGVIDVGAVFPMANPDAFPMVNALSVPGLFPSSTIAGMVNWKLYEEGYTANDYKNVKRLYVGYDNPEGFVFRNKQIKTLEDLKGMKIGCLSEPDTSTVELLGAIPVILPVQEHPTAMERGVIDGSYYEESASIAYGLYKVARYYTVTHGCIRSSETVMNLDTYNNLPPDIKAIIDKNSGLMWCLINAMYYEQHLNKVREFLNNRADELGLPHIYFLPPEEEARWQGAYNIVQERYLEQLESQGLPGRQLLVRAKELIQRYSEEWKFPGWK